jgi:hypothetical protein
MKKVKEMSIHAGKIGPVSVSERPEKSTKTLRRSLKAISHQPARKPS